MVLRKQHYLQACLQGSLIVYWGFYWDEVLHAAPLIAAQLLFAYGFDSLLSWTHRRTWAFGFGPFPIIFSITLFFWFKDDWFYLQFGLVSLGFLAKEFLRWTRDGINTHIFNPSSFPLAVVSVFLLLFNATDMTWGFQVALTEFYPPQMYLAIFLIGMPGQYLFGVTPMTMAAVVTTYVCSNCGERNAPGTTFCVNCHAFLAWDEVEGSDDERDAANKAGEATVIPAHTNKGKPQQYEEHDGQPRRVIWRRCAVPEPGGRRRAGRQDLACVFERGTRPRDRRSNART